MNRYQAAIMLYALINIGMGLDGYLGAHSMISLIAGSIIGILCIFFGTLSKTHPRAGFIGAAVVGLLTAGNWMSRLFDKDHKLVIYPALIGLILSVALVLFLVWGHLSARRHTAPAAPLGDHDNKS